MQEQFNNQATATTQKAFADDLPSCCGTGCTVCVLDYPEMFPTAAVGNDTGQVDPETLAQMAIMLEAIEQAELQARQLLAQNSGELQ